MSEVNIKDVVKQINDLGEQRETNILKIGKIVFDALQGMDYGAQKKVISEIKKDSDLKISGSYVWQGFNLYRNKPELLDTCPKLSISHYLALYKSNLSDSVRLLMETNAISEDWGVRELKKEINNWKKEKLKSEDSLKYEKKILLGKAHKIVNKFEIKQLKDFVGEWKVLLEKQNT